MNWKKYVTTQNWIVLFFILQPMIDIYRTMIGDVIDIFGISLLEMINLVFLAVLCCKLFIGDQKKMSWLVLAGYVVVMGGYLILHYRNMVSFDTSILSTKQYSLFQETYYITRLYFLPVFAFYLFMKAAVTTSLFTRIVQISVAIICGVIVCSDLYGISLVAYPTEMQKEFIHGNFLQWFSLAGGDSFDSYTAKGWFFSANQLSAILLILSPVIIKETLERCNLKNISLFILLGLSMVMLGTKTASYGFLGIAMAVFLLSIFFQLLEHHKIKNYKALLCVLLLTVACGGLLTKSPIIMKNSEPESEQREQPASESFSFENEGSLSVADYIRTYCWNYYIQPQLLDVYQVEKDTAFWVDKVERDVRLNSNYRLIKTEIFDRVFERSNRTSDKLLGIGTVESLYNEKDYLFQYYCFGLGGLLLFIGPFILALLIGAARVLMQFKKLFHFETAVLGMSLCIALLLPYFTGHVFGIVFPMYFIALIAATFINHTKQVKDDHK